MTKAPEPQARPTREGAAEAGETLAAAVRRLTALSWSRARELCRSGRVAVAGAVNLDDARRLVGGEAIAVHENAPRLRRGTLPDAAFVHVDAEVAVVNKPAGLLTVPYEHGDKDTLVDQTQAALRHRSAAHKSALGIVQRLDKDTTGVMVFTRTLAAKRDLAQQLRRHTVERQYVAIVHGTAPAATYETYLLADRGDGLRGSHGRFRTDRGDPPSDARKAITHVQPLAELRGATLVACKLETGRQHQIRIHLAEAGTPLVGETVYIRDFAGRTIPAIRPMLHARVLGFTHPRTGQPVRFEQEPPADFIDTLTALGGTWPPHGSHNGVSSVDQRRRTRS